MTIEEAILADGSNNEQLSMSLTVMRRIRFCAGHRLVGHDGKCIHFHGHNYVAEFYVTGETQDDIGRIIDFGVLKKKFKGWIDDNWDHAFVLWDQDENGLTAIRMVDPCRVFELPYNPTSVPRIALEMAPLMITNGLPRETISHQP